MKKISVEVCNVSLKKCPSYTIHRNYGWRYKPKKGYKILSVSFYSHCSHLVCIAKER